MELCRACLSTHNNMVPLDETFVNNYNLLTNLQITLFDEMPQHCCQTCLKTVMLFNEFREKCISNEASLRDILSTSNDKVQECEGSNVMEDPKIKVEVKEEVHDELFLNYDDEFGDYLAGSDPEDLKPKNLCRRKRKSTKKEIKATGPDDLKLKKLYNKEKKYIKPDKKMKLKPIEKTQDGEDKIYCGLCAFTFDSGDALTKHLNNHKPNIGCGLCSEQLDSLSQMFAHRLVHSPLKQMLCHICSKKYRKSLYLEYHYKSVHFKEENVALKCKLCSSLFASPRNLMKHTWSSHSLIRFYCDYCSKGFRSKGPLKAHIKCHIAHKNYFCDLCDFACKYPGGLKDHKVRRHAVDKTYCAICGRAFANQEEKDKHKCGKMPVVCPICGVEIRQRSRLSQHMLKHTNIYRFTCDRCPAKYKSASALIAHKNRHDGNRRFKCEFCHAMFYTQSVLIKHRRTHTGEKPYVCKVCGKAFTGNHNLKVHMKVHGEYLIVKKNKELKNETNNGELLE